MIDGPTAARDAVLVAVALVGGYLVGSIPTTRVVAPGARGPGWGFLARTVDLAKGVVPVAIGIVTWSWWIGLAAGLGAVIGARWSAFGHQTAGRPAQAVGTLAGAAFTLAPPAGLISALLAAATLGAGRLAGRDARVASATVGLASFPALFLVVHQDLARLAALLLLYLVALLRVATIRGR